MSVDASLSLCPSRPATKKFEDKVFIPQEHHPETNFVGLLIGPRYVHCGLVFLLYGLIGHVGLLTGPIVQRLACSLVL